jgi:uncharacterized membrane protein
MKEISNDKSILGFDENITATLGYLMGIGALVLYFAEKDNRFIRFHALQAVLYSVSLSIVLMVLIFFFGASNFQYPLYYLTAFGWMIGMIYAVVMAFQTRYFKFPVIGEIAEKWSGLSLEE